MTAILTLSGISLRFGGVAALSGVDVTINDSEVHSLIGPNGAGKSSLLNVMTGIYRPDAGSIGFGGRTYKQLPVNRLASLGLARTFQNVALFKGLSVRDNIAMGLTHRARATPLEQMFGLPRARRETAQAHDTTSSLIRRLDLARFEAHPVAVLPYGVQKRVELARALAAAPKILLLDEPMAGMSSGEKSEMCGFILAARQDWRTTVLLVEHDMGVVMGISDRVTVLDHGVRIADGTPAEVQADPAVIKAYLGIDEAQELVPADIELVA